MSGYRWRKIWMSGTLMIVVRGLLEVLRLRCAYPVLTDLPVLTIEVIAAYLGIAGIPAALAAFVFWRFTGKKEPVSLSFLLFWIGAVMIVDCAGFLVNAPVACLVSENNSAQKNSDPDVLLITIDTCRADYLGCYGHPEIKTPTLDWLARKGLILEETVTSIPVTTSGHATILTGVDPPAHGSRFNAVPINSDVQTLAERYRDKGYRTGAFVSAFPVTAEVSDLDRGFDIYDQLLTPSVLHPLLYRSFAVRWLTGFGPFRAAERSWDATVKSTKKWWQYAGDNPRFTWVHFYDPHFPYQPGKPFNQLYLDHEPQHKQSVFDVAMMNSQGRIPSDETIEEYTLLYMSEISAVDTAIHELLTELSDLDRLRNTMILVTADHGESLDEHQAYFTHGDDLFDPSLKVPWLACFPQSMPSNRIAGGQAPLKCTSEMICSVTGLTDNTKPSDEYGILKVWHGHGSMTNLVNSYCETGSGVYTVAHDPSDDSIRRKKRAVRTNRKKVIVTGDGILSGFNLDDDPAERNDLLKHENPEFDVPIHALFSYIEEVDPPDRRPPAPLDKNVLQRLQTLGYID